MEAHKTKPFKQLSSDGSKVGPRTTGNGLLGGPKFNSLGKLDRDRMESDKETSSIPNGKAFPSLAHVPASSSLRDSQYRPKLVISVDSGDTRETGRMSRSKNATREQHNYSRSSTRSPEPGLKSLFFPAQIWGPHAFS